MCGRIGCTAWPPIPEAADPAALTHLRGRKGAESPRPRLVAAAYVARGRMGCGITRTSLYNRRILVRRR